MNRLAPIPQSIVARSRIPPERIRFYDAADESIFEEIGSGVLFVMAFWSGPSVLAFSKLTEALAAIDPSGQLTLTVVDTDGLPDPPNKSELFSRRGGYGETAWLHKGQIVATIARGSDPNCFEGNTKALLLQCS
jgi:hypothetical protein